MSGEMNEWGDEWVGRWKRQDDQWVKWADEWVRKEMNKKENKGGETSEGMHEFRNE